MNKYLKNLKKIEFAVTYACTGHCKHCSVGERADCDERIDPRIAAEALRRIASVYQIKTVMVFGGEPLLHTEAVYAIISTAKEMGIEHRQVITNGYFSKDGEKICKTAERIAECGVNDLLISVDAFHQESIPLDTVKEFAKAAKAYAIPIRLQPAWLVSPSDSNPYNEKTRELLESLSDLELSVGDGNVIFPEGNAVKYLSEYFKDNAPENPYYEDPCDVKCLSFSPNGEVLSGNVYQNDIIDIIRAYRPNEIDSSI